MPSSVVLLLYSKPRKHDQVLSVLQYHVSDEHADTKIIGGKKRMSASHQHLFYSKTKKLRCDYCSHLGTIIHQ